MPESPDFEQIARALASGSQVDVNDTSALAADRRLEIAEQLRLVWNARGAADRSAIAVKAYELLGSASGAVHSEHFDRALKALDR